MLRYKLDPVDALRQAGYNSTRIRRENILPQSVLQKLRQKQVVGIIAIDQICGLLHMQPGDIIEWVPDGDEKGENKSPQ